MSNFLKILLLVLSVALCNSLKRQNLGGQWTAKNEDAGIVISNATVPGGVYSDLMNDGQIGDIFYGTGDSDYRWVGLADWTYTLSTSIDEEFLTHNTINLVFEGLDTFAEISINGQVVGSTQNMFVRYIFNVKDHLQNGTNEIVVQFHSSVTEAEILANQSSYVIPPDCPAKEYNGVCHANQIRKMQASFSWDWGPAFPSVGIWKEVYLEAFNSSVIDYVLATPFKNPDEDSWSLVITTYFRGGHDGHVEGSLTLGLQIENTIFNTIIPVDQSINEYDEIPVTTTIEIPAIAAVKTWWPNGYGDQNLYTLTVNFANDYEEDKKQVRIGFRTVELIQDELEQGLSFYFKINGYPIFAKGANEIPINVLPEKGQDPTVIKKVLQSARDVHMNMLRVWGGGVYESDYFYDLADEYGILIWQDFMFACAMYPADSLFLNNVLAEVRHQVKRLGSHASIAIWSGNNENEGALSDNWYGTGDNFAVYKNDYIKLYVDTIQSEVLRIQPNATFVTSSPSNGLETDKEDHVADNPGDPFYGDVHFYNYLSDSWSVATYPVPRFASEYGYQSLPSIESWLTATDNLSDLLPTSPFMDHRQHHPEGNTQNVNLINLELQLPDPSSENYLKAFIYFSQILQAQAIKIETEHYRSFKGRYNDLKQGNTMGALFWQLNDVWVAPTWSGMDFTGRWKMLQYAAKDFFSPLIVTGRINETDKLEMYAILDQLEVPENVTVTGLVHIYKWESLEPIFKFEYPVTLDPLKAVLVLSMDVRNDFDVLECGDNYEEAKTNCFFHLHLLDQNNNSLAPSNYVFPEKLKNSNIPNANLQISNITSVDDEGIMFDVTLTTDLPALFVWLDSHEITGRFSENGFLQVLPSKTVTFTADQSTTLDDLLRVMTVTHLRDPIYL